MFSFESLFVFVLKVCIIYPNCHDSNWTDFLANSPHYHHVKYFEETLQAVTFGFIQPRACPVACLKKC